ncbi:MAG: hypothetical protein IIU09_04365, partial [Bacteroidales bacterium]|nr:hypothetical protein [Bacteroidales bacterium]
ADSRLCRYNANFIYKSQKILPTHTIGDILNTMRVGGERGYLNGASDIHEADIEFQKRVRSMYLRQASLDKSLVRVDCAAPDGSMLAPDAIFAKLRAVYEER